MSGTKSVVTLAKSKKVSSAHPQREMAVPRVPHLPQAINLSVPHASVRTAVWPDTLRRTKSTVTSVTRSYFISLSHIYRLLFSLLTYANHCPSILQALPHVEWHDQAGRWCAGPWIRCYQRTFVRILILLRRAANIHTRTFP